MKNLTVAQSTLISGGLGAPDAKAIEEQICQEKIDAVVKDVLLNLAEGSNHLANTIDAVKQQNGIK